MTAMLSVTATPPAAANRWFSPSRSDNRAWPTNPRVIATTPGPSTPPCDPLQHFGESDQREVGPKAEDQNTRDDGDYAGRDQQSFRPHSIDEPASRHLTNQPRSAPYGEGKPDVFGCPLLYR